ncbi:zinc finger, CCHC-type containing protein [Tanacetum coccineum]
MIKKKPNLNYLRVWGCRAVVRLPGPKLKTLGERGIECIFVGYAEHSKAFRFYVIEPNDSVAIESRDAIFDEHRFSSVPKPSQTEYSGGSVVSERVTDEIDDPKTFDEAIKSQDVAFWKEAINDEMDSIMGNNTWVLIDLPPGCRPLGCKWIFKRKMKVDGTVEKFKARLVIQGFKQKSGIDYFDTYAPVARITFMNGELEEEAPKQWHQKFDEVILSNGYLLNQADKCVYSKFDASGKGVIICLYVDDMLIFGTDQVQMGLTKEFLSSRYTSNPGTQHWQAIQRVLKYLKKTMDYRLVYSGYPSVLEGYTDASWISNTEDNSSTRVFLLGGGAISWASKKQTCITGSTMESEFVALAAAGKEAKWLKNLLLEIPLYCTKLGRISIVRICSYRYLGWRYGVYTQRSLNTLIVVKGILVADELQRVNSSRSETLKDIHERSDGSAL